VEDRHRQGSASPYGRNSLDCHEILSWIDSRARTIMPL
jgi:hypothetical protein